MKIKGFCPMGCGRTLHVKEEGAVYCGWPGCPNPEAAGLMLMEKETEHVGILHDSTFTLKHPVRERISGDIMSCQLAGRLMKLFTTVNELLTTGTQFRVTDDLEITRIE